jgi:hypothetical protein
VAQEERRVLEIQAELCRSGERCPALPSHRAGSRSIREYLKEGGRRWRQAAAAMSDGYTRWDPGNANES